LGDHGFRVVDKDAVAVGLFCGLQGRRKGYNRFSKQLNIHLNQAQYSFSLGKASKEMTKTLEQKAFSLCGLQERREKLVLHLSDLQLRAQQSWLGKETLVKSRRNIPGRSLWF
jgi:hypothetical protein